MGSGARPQVGIGPGACPGLAEGMQQRAQVECSSGTAGGVQELGRTRLYAAPRCTAAQALSAMAARMQACGGARAGGLHTAILRPSSAGACGVGAPDQQRLGALSRHCRHPARCCCCRRRWHAQAAAAAAVQAPSAAAHRADDVVRGCEVGLAEGHKAAHGQPVQQRHAHHKDQPRQAAAPALLLLVLRPAGKEAPGRRRCCVVEAAGPLAGRGEYRAAAGEMIGLGQQSPTWVPAARG